MEGDKCRSGIAAAGRVVGDEQQSRRPRPYQRSKYATILIVLEKAKDDVYGACDAAKAPQLGCLIVSIRSRHTTSSQLSATVVCSCHQPLPCTLSTQLSILCSQSSTTMTSAPSPPAALDPQLVQQLDALLHYKYPTPPTADSTPASASAHNSDLPPASQLDQQPTTTTPITEPYNSRTAPTSALPPTAHLVPVLTAIAATGRLCGYAWPAVRELIIIRTRLVLDEYVRLTGVPPASPSDPSESFEPRVAHLLLLIGLFGSAPFTLQRLAELLCEPRQHYNSTSHYLAALCKCVYGITADEDDDVDEANDGAEDDERMEAAEMEAAGVQVTSAMDYVSKELPIVTVMPSVLSVEPGAADDHATSMETSE